MTRRFGIRWTRHSLRCAGFKYRAASEGRNKTKDPMLTDMHMDNLRWRLTHYVTENKVHHSLDETAAKLMGLGHRGWAKPKQDGRVRFIGAEDNRNLTISTVVTMTGTVMAQLIFLGRHETSAAEPQRQPLVHREHVPGADRLAWRLGSKTRILALVAAVELRFCPSKGFPAGVRTAHLECHVLFIPGGCIADLQPADIAIQRPLKHSIKEQAMQFFVESVCRDDAVLDLRLGTMKRLKAQWVIHASKEVEKKTHITAKAWRHLSWTFEEAPMLAASTSMARSSRRRELAEDEPAEGPDLILHDDDDDAEDEAHEVHDEEEMVPESTGTTDAEAVVPFPTVAAEIARAERFLYLRATYGRHPPKP